MLVARRGFTLQAAYWTVLTVAAVFLLAQMPFFLMSLRGVVDPETRGGFKLNLRSKSVVVKFCFLGVLGSVGFGVFFSLFPYYVNRKFGVESDALGTLFFISNFISAGANAIAPRVSRRLGTLKAIAATIGLATPFYLMIPLAPSFTWLSAFYIARRGFGAMSDPLISSLFMRLLYEEEKATANGVRMTALQIGSVGAPWLGGQLMENASLDLPAYVGAGLYPVVAASYCLLLRNETLEEQVQSS